MICYYTTLKVLRPYFGGPCRMWHKKGSSPRKSQQLPRFYGRGLQQCSLILRPRGYSNVVGFHGRGFIAMFTLRFTHDYSRFSHDFRVRRCTFQVLYKHKGLKKDTLLTKTHENSRFLTISHERGYYIATFLFDHKDSKSTSWRCCYRRTFLTLFLRIFIRTYFVGPWTSRVIHYYRGFSQPPTSSGHGAMAQI